MPWKHTNCAAQGFADYLKANYPEIEIVGEVENQDKGDIAYTQAQDFMTANPDLAGIYVTAGGPFGAAKAVQDAGNTGKVKVISFDFVDETMGFVKDGVISATIGQGPFAQGHDPAVRLFNYLVTGEAPECGRLLTEAALVTKDNIDQYWTARRSRRDWNSNRPGFASRNLVCSADCKDSPHGCKRERKFCVLRVFRSAMAACRRWIRSTSTCAMAKCMPLWAKTAPASPR